MIISRTAGYVHDQSVASVTWNINHNKNTNTPVIDFWTIDDAKYVKVFPLSIQVIDADNVTATFSSARSGKAMVV